MPKIEDISVSKSSAELKIIASDLAGEKVRVQAVCTNKGSNKKNKISRAIKLNSKGKETIKIKELNPDTKYSFKVKAKKKSGNSKYSKSETKRTKK